MRGFAIILPALATAAMAQPPSAVDADADATRTTELNRAIGQHNDTIKERNEAAEAAYRRDRAAYEAAKATNDRATAEAAAAERVYQADRAEHDAAMARWRAATGSRVASAAPPAAEEAMADPPASQRKLICHQEPVPGSLARTVRRCQAR